MQVAHEGGKRFDSDHDRQLESRTWRMRRHRTAQFSSVARRGRIHRRRTARRQPARGI
jgi:hypothetical protein